MSGCKKHDVPQAGPRGQEESPPGIRKTSDPMKTESGCSASESNNVEDQEWVHKQVSDACRTGEMSGGPDASSNEISNTVGSMETESDDLARGSNKAHNRECTQTSGARHSGGISCTSQDRKGEPNKRNILLVGTSGRGKSSVGNIIFDSNDFEISNSMDPGPDEIKCVTKDVSFKEINMKLTICDALTIQDKRMSKSEAKNDIKARLEKCFEICGDKFHFVIFVFSCTNRITPEFNVAFRILEKRLETIFSTSNAICVFTHGENFDLQRDYNNGPEFNTWCQNTEDPLLKKVVRSKIKQLLVYKKDTEKNGDARTKILKAVSESYTPVTPPQADDTRHDLDQKKYQSGGQNFKNPCCIC